MSLSQISTSPSSPSSVQIGGAYFQSSPVNHDGRDDDNDDEDDVNDDDEDFSINEENDAPDEEMQQHRRGPNNIFFIYRKYFAPSSLDVMERLQIRMNEAQH